MEPPLTTQEQPQDELSDFAEMLRDEREFPNHRAAVDPAVRRARRRRAWTVTAIVVAVMLVGSGSYVGWALTAPLSPPVLEAQTPAVPVTEATAIALPTVGASAISITGADEYIGADGIHLTSGADGPQEIASISKLITALVVLEAKPIAGEDDPGPTIWFDKAAHDLYDKYYVMGATIAAMPAGSSMSLRDALATMLIPSASNYAEAVSTWAYGSQGAFLAATRRWLDERGLHDTTIVEPTGIDARNTSTPSDLLALGEIAAANPVIAQIVATPSLSLPGPGTMHNTNDLLGHAGVTGLKTGNLGQGRFTLLYTASLDVRAAEPLNVIGVRLGGFSRDQVDRDVVAALESLRAGFRAVPLVTAGREVGSYSTPWGETARLVVSESASIRTWSDTPITVEMELTTPTAYEDGEVVGTVTWTSGPNTRTASIRLEGTIAPPTDWWRLTHPSELGGS